MISPVIDDLLASARGSPIAQTAARNLRHVVPLVRLAPEAAADPVAHQIVAALTNLLSRTFRILVLDVPDVDVDLPSVPVDVPFPRGLAQLAEAINPAAIVAGARVDSIEPTHTVTVGDPGTNAPRPIRVDSDGWNIFYSSRAGPPPWAAKLRSRHPASPLAAASIGAAVLTRDALRGPAVAPPSEEWVLNLLTYTPSIGVNPEVPRTIHMDDVHIFGVGSIGSTATHALQHAHELTGRITIVDREVLSPKNMRRYHAMLDPEDKRPKARWAAEMLAERFPGCEVTARVETFGAWAGRLDPDYRIPIALIAPDTLGARREAADFLPRAAILASTHGSCAEVVHAHFGTTMCGYCEYVDKTHGGTQLRFGLADQTGLSPERLDTLLYWNPATDPAKGHRAAVTPSDVATIEAHLRVASGTLAHWAGRDMNDFLAEEHHRLYSAVAAAPAASRWAGAVSLPAVSAFAGALAACEIIKESVPTLHDLAGRYGKYRNDVFSPPTSLALYWPRRDTTFRCLCHNRERQLRHARLWPDEADRIREWSEQI